MSSQMQRYAVIILLALPLSLFRIYLTWTQGLAIITVLKAGFLGSARYGNGIVVARLADGSWSAPSAIGLGGAGFGGQIGFELTGMQNLPF